MAADTLKQYSLSQNGLLQLLNPRGLRLASRQPGRSTVCATPRRRRIARISVCKTP